MAAPSFLGLAMTRDGVNIPGSFTVITTGRGLPLAANGTG